MITSNRRFKPSIKDAFVAREVFVTHDASLYFIANHLFINCNILIFFTAINLELNMAYYIILEVIDLYLYKTQFVLTIQHIWALYVHVRFCVALKCCLCRQTNTFWDSLCTCVGWRESSCCTSERQTSRWLISGLCYCTQSEHWWKECKGNPIWSFGMPVKGSREVHLVQVDGMITVYVFLLMLKQFSFFCHRVQCIRGQPTY